MEAFLVAVWLLGWVGLIAAAAYNSGRADNQDEAEWLGICILFGVVWPLLAVAAAFAWLISRPFVALYNLGQRHADKDRAP